MAKREAKATPAKEPKVPLPEVVDLLSQQIGRAHEMMNSGSIDWASYDAWNLVTTHAVQEAFGPGSPQLIYLRDGDELKPGTVADENDWYEYREERLLVKATMLMAFVDILKLEVARTTSEGPTKQMASEETRPRREISGHRAFLVHGRDERWLHETARVLDKLKLQYVILREQPNKGRTIIKKFEDHADVGFAVVLLTPDDRGGLADAPPRTQKKRARQNVILELGFFLGRLGRERVCALYVPGVEIPSDYSGVAYVELDEKGAWHTALAKEMKAAGLPVDLNLFSH